MAVSGEETLTHLRFLPFTFILLESKTHEKCCV